MAKRVFTKRFSGNVAVTGMAPVTDPGIVSDLQEEDIEVIGAEISLVCFSRSESDGQSTCMIELSQTSTIRRPGCILTAWAEEGWNSVPAGIEIAVANVVLALPAGFSIPVKEEGYLYVNAYSQGHTADTSIYAYDVTVYYTKRGA